MTKSSRGLQLLSLCKPIGIEKNHGGIKKATQKKLTEQTTQ
jgi:hypothetical protein